MFAEVKDRKATTRTMMMLLLLLDDYDYSYHLQYLMMIKVRWLSRENHSSMEMRSPGNRHNLGRNNQLEMSHRDILEEFHKFVRM